MADQICWNLVALRVLMYCNGIIQDGTVILLVFIGSGRETMPR